MDNTSISQRGKLKIRWQNVDEGRYPPKDNKGYYGDRYSVPVLIGDCNTAYVSYKAHAWDYLMGGWVEFDLNWGPDPEDYDIFNVTHWALWPICSIA